MPWVPKISGLGTSVLTIQGVTSLNGATHKVLPDRIETGTFAACVAMAGGRRSTKERTR